MKYICDCGKEFDNSQSFNAHKSHCKTHHLLKYGNLDVLQQRNAKAKLGGDLGRRKRQERLQAKKQIDLSRWISEKHTCEHCGKVMTEKYGSGRFCCQACAKSRNMSKETKTKISVSMQQYSKLHERTAKQAVHMQTLFKYNKVKAHAYTTCAYCGKIIDLTGKKRNQSNRYYCNGTCRNLHLNKLKIIGGINSGKNTSKWEKLFQEVLLRNNINFEANKRDLIPSGLEVDIWLPDYNIAIELNGIWHYSEKPYAGNLEKFNRRQQKDKLKEKEILELGYDYYVFEDRNIIDYERFFTEFIQKVLLKKT